ncbi:MAG: hypothetical protein AUH75_04150 [Gemmatimonadetes bacterium 13_1_40CM_4_65_7]|nr:MAG: hypothetical protein AUH75_04150 [Gemmatimonadetes bacterium 13_1_40CM_4_65_7]
MSDLACQREAREERGWPGGRAWPLLLITIIAVLYPFEYDTGLTNYSLGDAVVGPVALFVVLRSLVGRLVGWPRYTVQLLALVVVAIASSLANAFSPAIYFCFPQGCGCASCSGCSPMTSHAASINWPVPPPYWRRDSRSHPSG